MTASVKPEAMQPHAIQSDAMQIEAQRRRARRTAILLGVLALCMYLGFILATELRN